MERMRRGELGKFPFLLGRAFIEASTPLTRAWSSTTISLPFREGFH